MDKIVFRDKTIVLGVSGGIAAYKAADLADKLVQEEATVKVVMSQNATKFVDPLEFQSVTNQTVLTDLFDGDFKDQIYHVSLSEEADITVIAPATANIIAKAACGIADDALSTVILAARSKIVMVPAMNNHMWLNEATQHNLAVLKSRGIEIIEPEVGRLACGEENAVGRFPKTETVMDYLGLALARTQDLAGKTLLVTAGGTREPIDPVRYIGNRSSGKMGYAVAKAAVMRGAQVILVSGVTNLSPPYGAKFVSVETAEQMLRAVIENLEQADTVVMAAAVADFKPSRKSLEKIKKERMPKSVELELNPDILQAIADRKTNQIIIGFAAESQDMVVNATRKLKKKNLDLIVANDIAKPGVGFASDLNTAVLIDKKGQIGDIKTYKKTSLAEEILDWLGTYSSFK